MEHPGKGKNNGGSTSIPSTSYLTGWEGLGGWHEEVRVWGMHQKLLELIYSHKTMSMPEFVRNFKNSKYLTVLYPKLRQDSTPPLHSYLRSTVGDSSWAPVREVFSKQWAGTLIVTDNMKSWPLMQPSLVPGTLSRWPSKPWEWA